ncbi:MAG: hypothetical protein Q8N23_30680 [Archangium sp.]|nr:hypothetical protein [Archangium sp.]MDP3157077.1 hypothetical protein [Archangium sp.]MDP3575794.1 hypothetical protein [Archangium sp.]
MNQKQLVVAIVGAVVIVNLIGFALFLKGRAAQAAAQAPAPAAVVVPVAPLVENASLEREQLARARRVAGVAALEAGDYDKALINFTEAQALIGAAAKVEELLKITEDLRARLAARKTEELKVDAPVKPVAPARAAPSRPTARSTATAPRVAAVERAPEVRPTEAPAPIVTGSGMLLVSTTPRGLLVQIDGTPMDLTPMRAPVKVGSHRIALFDGDRKIYDTTVDITEGNVATVLKDLSVETAPKEAPRADPRAVEVARLEPKPAVKPTETPAVRVPAPVERPEPEPAPSSAKTGLAISAPGLYGEVWLNGRPVGFAPVTVEDMKPGPVKIEVRVNGVVKRSTTALVEAGQIKAVRVVR